MITPLFSPASQQPYMAVVLRIAGGNHAAFTRGAQIFGWIKAEASDIADAAGTPSVIFGARCLRRVFDDYQLMAAGNFQDRIHVGWESVQVDRHDRASFFR